MCGIRLIRFSYCINCAILLQEAIETRGIKNMKNTRELDLLHGPLLGSLIRFALPIALSSMLQQLFNAMDTSVVGRFADANALAAVGTNGEIVALLVTVSSGLAVGANVWVAHCIGEQTPERIPPLLHTALLLAAALGVGGALAGQAVAAPLLRLLHTPEDILPLAVLYLRLYFAGYPFLLLYDFGSAILRAKGDSRRPFGALAASGILNVALNLFFVLACGLGVAGVALATALSTAVSAALVLYWLAKEPGAFRLSLRHLHLDGGALRRILRVGIPSAVQGAVFCFANLFVQADVNRFGPAAIAGSTIAMNFEYFGYFFITAFGQAATTFTSQNFAAGQLARCRKILWLGMACAAGSCALLTVPLTVFHAAAAALFSPEPAVIAAAGVRILHILAFEPLCACYEVPSGVLRGTGHSALPAGLTILGTCLLRIVWSFTVFQHFGTLESLYLVFPLSWCVTTALVWAGYAAVRPLKKR